MLFYGTFQIQAFQELERKRDRIVKEARKAAQGVFIQHLVDGLHEFGEYLPSLTGDLRRQFATLSEALSIWATTKGIDVQVKELYSGMTESLFDNEGIAPLGPQSTRPYSKPHSPHRQFLGSVSRREDWASLQKQMPRGYINSYGDATLGLPDFKRGWSANQYFGKYTFYFEWGEGYFADMLEEVYPAAKGRLEGVLDTIYRDVVEDTVTDLRSGAAKALTLEGYLTFSSSPEFTTPGHGLPQLTADTPSGIDFGGSGAVEDMPF